MIPSHANKLVLVLLALMLCASFADCTPVPGKWWSKKKKVADSGESSHHNTNYASDDEGSAAHHHVASPTVSSAANSRPASPAARSASTSPVRSHAPVVYDYSPYNQWNQAYGHHHRATSPRAENENEVNNDYYHDHAVLPTHHQHPTSDQTYNYHAWGQEPPPYQSTDMYQLDHAMRNLRTNDEQSTEVSQGHANAIYGLYGNHQGYRGGSDYHYQSNLPGPRRWRR